MYPPKSYIFDFATTSGTFAFTLNFQSVSVYFGDLVHIPALLTTHRTFW